ncbi:MAG: hypothetical protein R2939_12405 [Kofleriaceae bacterium]
MSTTKFFTAALTSALEVGLATPDDILAHVTPHVLGVHLPRPLWARLITAALGSPQLSAQVIVDTIGVGNLCEHVPAAIIWGCLADIAQRSLGSQATSARAATVPTVSAAPSTVPPPIERDPEVDSALDALELGDDGEADATGERPRRGGYRAHSVTSAGQTSRALAGASSRRPQRRSQAAEPVSTSDDGSGREGGGRDVEVDEEQLVEWSASEETATSDEPRGGS